MQFKQIYSDWDVNLISRNDNKAYLLANFLSNGQYKTSEMLRQNEVILATDVLLQKLDCHLDESNIHNFDFKQMGDLKTLLDNTKKYQKPQIVQLSNNSHWITACLLPGGESGVTVVSMDSIGPQGLLMQELQNNIKSIKEYKNLDFHNLSVEGQQYGNCCGLAAAMNSVSIIKTFQEDFKDKLPLNSKGRFDVEKFKNANNNNVFYQENQQKQLILFGQVIEDITIKVFLEKFGGNILQSIEQQIIKNTVENLKSLKNSIPTVEEMKMKLEAYPEKVTSSLSNQEKKDFQKLSDEKKAEYLVNKVLNPIIFDLRFKKSQEERIINLPVKKKAKAISKKIKNLENQHSQNNSRLQNDYAEVIFALKLALDKEKESREQQVLEDNNLAKIQSLKSIQKSGMKTFSALIAKDPAIKTHFLLPEIGKILEYSNIFSWIISRIMSYIFGDSKEKDFNDGLTKMIKELEDNQPKKFQNQLKQSRESVSQSKGIGG